jgi:hypothetical protein
VKQELRGWSEPGIEGGGFGFVDALLGVTRMGSDDGRNGGGFHGRLGLNARHITLVAGGAGYVQRSIREMNVCSSLPFLPPAGRPKVTKDAVIAPSRRSEPDFSALLLGVAKSTPIRAGTTTRNP